MTIASYDAALNSAGVGAFQKRLFAVFGLVWAADAMQVLAIGFTATSIAVTFAIPVQQALQAGSALFLGMLVGAFLFGRLADRFGRRPVLIASVLIDATFGLASAFAPSFGWLIALRFLTGLGVGGTLPVDYAMMAEFLPADRRGRWLVALEGFWAVGTVVLALTSLAAQGSRPDDAWRIVFAVTAAPALIGLVLRLLIPESPLFLFRRGRIAEANVVLAQVARANGHAGIAADLSLAVQPDATPGSAPSIFRPDLRRRSALILAVWLLVSASYYGVFVWLPVRLAGQGFGFLRGEAFLVLVALAQVPGYALAAYGVERWGRRPTLVAFLLLSAIGCFAFGLGSSVNLLATATLLMSFALLGTWGALYAFTPELFPTELRATGMGSAGAMARLGGLLSPTVFAPLIASSFSLALAVFAALLALAAALTVTIDLETRRMPLE
ncbi:MFS transporter [Methylobacterium sp. WL18]|uniref:MFS transporter n=1 Tax=Methylobacterium sp. WL18 TaxID=2603897 RepID=UPI0011CA5BD9|nr:MFS transporter [Methylobacterium sp. WL18]TXN74644.1 MFS transporter [Methylobacterium sp. WL18]